MPAVWSGRTELQLPVSASELPRSIHPCKKSPRTLIPRFHFLSPLMGSNSPEQQSNNHTEHRSSQNTTELHDSNRPWPSTKVAMSGSAGRTDMDDSEDSIEDDYDSYDELFTQHFTDDKLLQLDGLRTQPISLDRARSLSPERGPKSQHKSGQIAKRFVLQSRTASKPESSNDTPSTESGLPWAQRYAPRTLEELAVHKRKVRDVEHWLDDALAGRSRKNLLVLKGPAGSGKTATISLLSDKLNFRVLEWKSPSASEYASKDYISLGAQFDGFLSRGHTFSSLDLDSHEGVQVLMQGQNYTSRRRVILIEEFPTISGRGVSNLAAFRLSILRYISMNASPTRTRYESEPQIPPIVMIVTETFSNLESSLDHLSAHRLLGHELYNHPSTTVLEFNTVAPTFMSKALNSILKRCAHQPFSHKPQAQSTIAHLSKMGDIRNAIASLEFICLGSGNPSYRSKLTVEPMHTTRKRKVVSPVSSEVPNELAPRAATLGLFHAVGKIIYNKRNHGPDSTPAQPPLLLGQSGTSPVDVNDLPEETGTDIQSFISTLHENYVPSCNGFSFTECLDGCIGSLSDSDMLCVDRTSHTSRFRAGLGTGLYKSGASVDVLRQEEISYQVATRGLLFALPCPVKRQLSGTSSIGRPNDSYKLSFPPAIRLLRQYEEIKGLVSSVETTLLGLTIPPIADPSSRQDQPTRQAVSWSKGFRSRLDESLSPFMTLVSRSDLILHQLPYMTMILDAGAGSMNLQVITSLGARDSGYDERQDEENPWDSSVRGRNASSIRAPKLVNIVRGSDLQKPLAQQLDDEQLILSDDDIVDEPGFMPT
ncbi:Rad17 cell cycle checkpoint protein-domain-containing protein [Aspergillus oleicola]